MPAYENPAFCDPSFSRYLLLPPPPLLLLLLLVAWDAVAGLGPFAVEVGATVLPSVRTNSGWDGCTGDVVVEAGADCEKLAVAMVGESTSAADGAADDNGDAACAETETEPDSKQ